MADQIPHYKANLKKLGTEELERGIDSGSLSAEQVREARRVLRDRYAEPDRNIQRWIRAIAIGALVATMLTWLMI